MSFSLTAYHLSVPRNHSSSHFCTEDFLDEIFHYYMFAPMDGRVPTASVYASMVNGTSQSSLTRRNLLQSRRKYGVHREHKIRFQAGLCSEVSVCSTSCRGKVSADVCPDTCL